MIRWILTKCHYANICAGKKEPLPRSLLPPLATNVNRSSLVWKEVSCTLTICGLEVSNQGTSGTLSMGTCISRGGWDLWIEHVLYTQNILAASSGEKKKEFWEESWENVNVKLWRCAASLDEAKLA